eukprot:CAMPEP_0183304796 /NCGR_PEP_ID=MMETSP0160_2-20130417/9762_1 /TAXON_ID=2839 ORGANISM="Odontella Sinensis, Strain Grunow 1884" /NCGR_SAMPLE_ID=MMETSP0160_2 /ASSEMBLY_ACC=CAM_ASM_000250 /LENGTH=266 /DNA_ID=CAMNT_0025467909 /DNA_START=62 /DNA_END=862 /DNA_ORIENTATION=-
MRTTSLLLAAAASGLAGSVASAFVPSNPIARRGASVRPQLQLLRSTAEKNTVEGKEIDGEFVPMNDMILVRKAKVEDVSEGGLFLTGKSKIEKNEGLVVSIGPGRTNLETGFRRPMPVSPGETVLYGDYVGIPVTYNGVKHTLIQDDDVLVKFSEGKDSESVTAADLEGVEVLWDAVLVKVPEREDDSQSSSGILLAKSSTGRKKKSSVGDVVKVGPGRLAFDGTLMEMDVTEGDKIKYRDFAAQEVTVGGEEYAVVRMTDILAKF